MNSRAFFMRSGLYEQVMKNRMSNDKIKLAIARLNLHTKAFNEGINPNFKTLSPKQFQNPHEQNLK